jgi:hypothetical protein
VKKLIILGALALSTQLMFSQATFNSHELEHEFKNTPSISVVAGQYLVFDGRPTDDKINYIFASIHSPDSSFTFYVNPGEVIDLGYHDGFYPGVEVYCRRKITLYRNNGQVDVYYRNTTDRSFTIQGDFIYRVDMSAPTKEDLDKYPKGYLGDQVVINDGTRDSKKQ